MQLLKWSTELELGLDQIDSQHKQLINIINELNIAAEYNQPNSVLLPIVDKLQQYANSHFSAEEDIFTTYSYPGRVEHEAEHATFIDSIKYIRRQCEIIDTPMSTKIRDFLLHWFCTHIKVNDMDYKRFIDSGSV
ncbi:MAG TPA: hemerythrin family protein [Desulfuromonadales bacterium]|nr:hemerythrin family protein [Desulfuromonadales bacterium]